MSIGIIGQFKVLKDENGTYRTAIPNKIIDTSTGEEKTEFKRLLIGFKKGLNEPKNKSKIEIKEGKSFLTWYKIPTSEVDENGNNKKISVWKVMVLDYELLEEGIDEVEKPFQQKDTNQRKTNQYSYSAFEINEYGDDLPF